VRWVPTLAAVFLLLPPQPARAEPLIDRLLIVAPAAPGGGWDQTARAMQYALEREGLVRIVEVQNVAGAAGTIGLAQFVDAQRGNGAALLVTGLVMLGATLWNESPVSLAQVTPIARLTDEYEVIAVPAASPHRDLRGLVAALRAAPGQVSWGGGSAGGTDHILAGLVGVAAGVDPRRVNYIAFSGGGEAVAALLGGNVTAGVSGYSEFAPHIASGRLRALAISAPSRIAGVNAPTIIDQGFNVDLANWRGVVAPPDIAPGDTRRLSTLITRMVATAAWRQTLADREWRDAYQGDAAFARYLDAERLRIGRIVAKLRGPGETRAARAGGYLFPTAIFTGAALVALGLWRQRRRVPSAEPRANTRAVVAVTLALAVFLALLYPLGFVAASAALFAMVAHVFEARRSPVIVGVAFSVLVYLAFTRGLDLALPPGAIWSWIR
jgi:putative tricarboxylic transport membrane protein